MYTIYVYLPRSMQITTFSKICREVLCCLTFEFVLQYFYALIKLPFFLGFYVKSFYFFDISIVIGCIDMKQKAKMFYDPCIHFHSFFFAHFSSFLFAHNIHNLITLLQRFIDILMAALKRVFRPQFNTSDIFWNVYRR